MELCSQLKELTERFVWEVCHRVWAVSSSSYSYFPIVTVNRSRCRWLTVSYARPADVISYNLFSVIMALQQNVISLIWTWEDPSKGKLKFVILKKGRKKSPNLLTVLAVSRSLCHADDWALESEIHFWNSVNMCLNFFIIHSHFPEPFSCWFQPFCQTASF